MAGDGESLERRLKNALEKHKITLKVEQRQAIEQLYMKKKDLIAILPTGFGKSMIFLALVLLARYECEDDKLPVVLIITPLITIIKDQIVELESLGLLGCNLAEVLDDLSLLSRADLLYASAESAIDKRFSKFLKQKSNGFVDRALAIIVDESHTIQTWAGLSKDKNNKTTVAFRSAYGKLSFLKSFFGKDIPFAALTGTADEETQEIICSSLCMKDPLTIAISPNRKNVRFHQKKDMVSRLDWLIQDLMKTGMLAEKINYFL